MENVKDQVVETTEITEEQQPTTNEHTDPKPEPFGFTQEQLDDVVAKRLAREREAIAKKLGIDKYEAVDSFLEKYQTTLSEQEEINEKYSSIVEIAFDKELRLNALMAGVKPEHLDRVVKLANAELENVNEDDELDIPKAIEIILDEFPMLKTQEQAVRKIGQEPSSESTSKTEMDRYLDKYKDSKYFNK